MIVSVRHILEDRLVRQRAQILAALGLLLVLAG
jgi:hypothetical protein